jgi:SOS response regulatory protein OraA/RecX
MDTVQLGAHGEALEVALKLIATRERFEAEVRQLLADRGYDTDASDAVVSFLRDRKILHDQRTTFNLIEQRSGRRSVGREKLRSELLARGAPEEIIEECLGQVDGELERALELLRAKFPGGGSPGSMGRFLCSRGFEVSIVESALERLFGSDDLLD